MIRHWGYGWEVVFWTVGAAGLLWVPIWLALVRPGNLDNKADLEVEPEGDVHRSICTSVLIADVLVVPANVYDPVCCHHRLDDAIAVPASLAAEISRESQGFFADTTDWIVKPYHIGMMWVAWHPVSWSDGS